MTNSILTLVAGTTSDLTRALAAIGAAPPAPGATSARLAPPAGLSPEAIRGSLTPLAVDFALARPGPMKLLVADMDSTIIGCECIDELADYAGKKAEIAGITERAMAGELDFEAALTARVAMLSGLPEAMLQRCFEERVRLNPGARRLVATMAAAGARCVLVSGGFTFFTERVAALAGFHAHRANRLVIADGRLTGAVELPILGRAAKLEALRAEAHALGIGLEDTVAIGDGANDLDMIEAAGLGIAYRAKPIVAARAGARIAYGDLDVALAFQGLE